MNMGSHVDRWIEMHDQGRTPWDSGAPNSQLVRYFSSCISKPDEAVHCLAEPSTSDPTWPSAHAQGLHSCTKCTGFKGTQHAGKGQAGYALELGCGTGASAAYMATCGLHVVGVDCSPLAIQTARATAARLGVAPGCVHSAPHQNNLLGSGLPGNDTPSESPLSHPPAPAHLSSAQSCPAQASTAHFLCHDLFTLPHPFTPLTAHQIHLSQTPPHQHDGACRGSCSAHPSPPPPGCLFDFVFDCQSWHVLRRVDEGAYVRLLTGAVRPGGTLLLIAGAVEEEEREQQEQPPLSQLQQQPQTQPHSPGQQGGGQQAAGGSSTPPTPPQGDAPKVCGPPRVSQGQVRAAFCAPDWEEVCMVRTRFDPTPHYRAYFPQPPPAWVCVFRRR